jgi:hypothetical protein
MDLSLAISEGVGRWAAAKDDTGERVIEDWGQMTDWGKQHRLREDGEPPACCVVNTARP